MTNPWRVPVAVFMMRFGDGTHEATGWSLELEPYTGAYFCSCGSSAGVVASGGLLGCLAVREHGCRNQEEVHKFMWGLIGSFATRIHADKNRGRSLLRV